MSGASRWSHKTQNRRKKKLSVNGKKKKKTIKLSCQQKGRITWLWQWYFFDKAQSTISSAKPNRLLGRRREKRKEGTGKREEGRGGKQDHAVVVVVVAYSCCIRLQMEAHWVGRRNKRTKITTWDTQSIKNRYMFSWQVKCDCVALHFCISSHCSLFTVHFSLPRQWPSIGDWSDIQKGKKRRKKRPGMNANPTLWLVVIVR